jgi:hypothetical protein
MTERRWGALAAVATVVLWVVGFNLAGKPPKFDASAQSIAEYFYSNHKSVLIASVLVAIGIVFYLFAMAQLVVVLRDAGQVSLGAMVAVCAAASAGLLAVGDAIYGTLGQAVQDPEASAGTAKIAYQLDQFAGIPMYWIVTGIVFSVSAAILRGLFMRPALILNSVILILLVLGGLSVKGSGAFSSTGWFAEVAFVAALVFLLEVALLLWREKAAADAQMTA